MKRLVSVLALATAFSTPAFANDFCQEVYKDAKNYQTYRNYGAGDQWRRTMEATIKHSEYEGRRTRKEVNLELRIFKEIYEYTAESGPDAVGKEVAKVCKSQNWKARYGN